jgi:hypothetical protein
MAVRRQLGGITNIGMDVKEKVVNKNRWPAYSFSTVIISQVHQV